MNEETRWQAEGAGLLILGLWNARTKVLAVLSMVALCAGGKYDVVAMCVTHPQLKDSGSSMATAGGWLVCAWEVLLRGTAGLQESTDACPR